MLGRSGRRRGLGSFAVVVNAWKHRGSREGVEERRSSEIGIQIGIPQARARERCHPSSIQHITHYETPVPPKTFSTPHTPHHTPPKRQRRPPSNPIPRTLPQPQRLPLRRLRTPRRLNRRRSPHLDQIPSRGVIPVRRGRSSSSRGGEVGRRRLVLAPGGPGGERCWRAGWEGGEGGSRRS